MRRNVYDSLEALNGVRRTEQINRTRWGSSDPRRKALHLGESADPLTLPTDRLVRAVAVWRGAKDLAAAAWVALRAREESSMPSVVLWAGRLQAGASVGG